MEASRVAAESQITYLMELLQVPRPLAESVFSETGGNMERSIECVFSRASAASGEAQQRVSSAASSARTAAPLALTPMHASSVAARADVDFGPLSRSSHGGAAKRQRTGAAFVLKDNAGDPEHESPVEFRQYPLWPQQRRSLYFMVNRERSGQLWEHTRSCCGGVLGDRMGYGKTAATIALISSQRLQPLPPNPEPDHYLSTKASLVIVPKHLLQQWQSEFKKFLGKDLCGLKLLVIGTVQQLSRLSFDELGQADVVLTSYNVSMENDKYRRQVGFLAKIVLGPDRRFIPVDYPGLPQRLRNINNYTTAQKLEMLQFSKLASRLQGDESPKNFPVFEAFFWRRLVMDEFHESEIWGTAQREMLKFVRAHYRWGLSGTPPVGDGTSVTKMAALMGADLRHESNAVLQSFLDHYVRQNDVQGLPPVEETCVEVRLSRQEYFLYRQECMDVGSLNPEIEDLASIPQNLRARLLMKCAHFCCDKDVDSTGSAFTHIQGQKEKAVAELEEQLCIDASRLELLGATCQKGELTQAAHQAFQENQDGCRSPELQRSVDKALASSAQGMLAAKIVTKICPSNDVHLLVQPVAPTQYVTCDRSRRMLTDALVLLSSNAHKRTTSFTQHQVAFFADARDIQQTALMRILKMLDAAQRSLAFFQSQLSVLQGSQEERSCSICMDEDVPLEQIAITSCAHAFHMGCIRDWLTKQNRCPVCNYKPLTLRDVAALPTELDNTKDAQCQTPFDCEGELHPLRLRFGSKLHAVAKTLQQIRENDASAKVLVFVQWETLLHVIADALRAYGIKFIEYGRAASGELLQRFQEDRSPKSSQVLLLSLEKCASGTNLTVANHVMLVSPMCAESLEAAVAYEKQAIGRVRRPGQERDRIVLWRFISRDTIEEHITKRHQRELKAMS